MDVIEQEQIDMNRKLFAVTCDEIISSKDAAKLSSEMVSAGLWRIDWVRHLQSGFIPNFCARKNPRAYRLNLERLIKLMHGKARPTKSKLSALHQTRR